MMDDDIDYKAPEPVDTTSSFVSNCINGFDQQPLIPHNHNCETTIDELIFYLHEHSTHLEPNVAYLLLIDIAHIMDTTTTFELLDNEIRQIFYNDFFVLSPASENVGFLKLIVIYYIMEKSPDNIYEFLVNGGIRFLYQQISPSLCDHECEYLAHSLSSALSSSDAALTLFLENDFLLRFSELILEDPTPNIVYMAVYYLDTMVELSKNTELLSDSNLANQLSFEKQSISFHILDTAFASPLPITLKIAFSVLTQLPDCSSFLLESKCFERFPKINQMNDDDLNTFASNFFLFLMENYEHIDPRILDSLFEISDANLPIPPRQERALHILNALVCKNENYAEIFSQRHPFEELLLLFNGSLKVKQALLWLLITIALNDQYYILCHPTVMSVLIAFLDVNSPQLIVYILRSLRSIFAYQQRAPPDYPSVEKIFKDNHGYEKLVEMQDFPDRKIAAIIAQILLFYDEV
jgi:hypothetical protein